MNEVLSGASGASFSDCRRYRYFLWRLWDFTKPPANFVMLNPSTADETKNDPTVERCQRRSHKMGYGGLIVTNIFAYRSTDPSVLRNEYDPIGPKNDEAILKAAGMAGIIVCGWGTHGVYMDRGLDVLSKLVGPHGKKLHHLGMTNGGQPRHPLYIHYDTLPKRWTK